MSLVQFSIGSGTSALPPPYHGAMLSTTVSPTVRDAPHAFPFEEAGPAPPSITLLVQRTRLIRGTVVPNSLCVSVNDNVAYVANKEGEWFVVDLADVQLAMRWHLSDFLSKCENKVAAAPSTTGAGVQKANGSSSSLKQQPRPFVLPSTTSQQRVTFRDDANEQNISNASSFTVVHITSIDAHETWVVLGLSSGETILLQRTKGRLSRGVYAIRQYIDLVGLSTNTPGNNKHINNINSIHDSRSVLSRICPNSHTIVSIVRGKELVLWSLSPELQFSVLQRSPLLAATATTTDSTAAPSFSSLTDVSVHVLTDAMEVWSCGADGINYAWVSQFPRAQHEVHATQREADAICESNGVALIDWHVVVSRMGAESQLGVFAATDALCKASEADVFRRYFWKWLQFRLEHQLQRKHDSIAVFLARSEFHRIGRDSFRKWVTFRNDRLRQKRNINAAAAIQALIAQQRMHGALTLWQRYRVHRRRQRECVSRVQILLEATQRRQRAIECVSRVQILLEATQRRQRAIAYSRLRAFSRLQRLRRRWMLFSSTLENETVKALQRAVFMRWWGLRQRNIEIAHRNRIADSLANDVAHKQHAQFTFTTWKAYLEQKKRRAVLSSWSNTLGLNSTALVCSQYFHSWVQQAYLKRGEASLAKLKAAETSANALESKIMSAAPKVQRLRRVANLKERLAGCKDRMDELRDVQDGIAVRVTMLRLAERQDTEQQNRRESVSRCGSPLFAGCAAPPPHTTVEPQDALDASRRSNRSNVVGRGAGLDDTFRSADGSHNNTNNKDEPQPTPPVPGGSAASRGGESSLAHVEQSAVDMFPQSISWLKKRILNFNTDEALIVQVVEKARGSGAGSFTGSVSGTPAKKLFLVTLQHIEKRVRDAFGATSTTDGRSNSVMSRTSGDDRSGQTPTAAERLATGSPHSLDDFATSSEQPLVDMWMPEEATEVELRAAIIRLVEKSPAIARGLLRDILSLVISYDCMPTGERRSGIPERSRAAFVHHAEVLDIIHDSLQRCGVTLTSL
ncbi:Hypothetical protein, putative [Bodo saltans]|nr:Hypothetical protein, putative [Bodo saltans]|eukprot:CUG93579.1 Hypothetical protein, putative [Bodo saltans]